MFRLSILGEDISNSSALLDLVDIDVYLIHACGFTFPSCPMPGVGLGRRAFSFCPAPGPSLGVLLPLPDTPVSGGLPMPRCYCHLWLVPLIALTLH